MPKIKEHSIEDCFSEEYDNRLLESMKRLFGDKNGILQHISLEVQREEFETIYSMRFYVKPK